MLNPSELLSTANTGLTNPTLNQSVTDRDNVQLPPLRRIKCIEWAWGKSLQIKAAHGDFSLFGIGAEDPSRTGQKIEELLGVSNLDGIQAHFQSFVERNIEPPPLEIHVTFPTKTVFLKLETEVLDNGSGQLRLFSYFEDVTALKKAENQVQLLHQVIDAIPSWIFIKNTAHDYEMVNSAYASFYNATPDQCQGKNSVDLGVPREIAQGCEEKGIRGFWQDDTEVFQSGKRKEILCEPIVVEGETRFLQTIKTPIEDPESGRQLLVGFCHDITYLKQIESRMRIELRHNKTLCEVGKIFRRHETFGKDAKLEICQLLKASIECDAVFIDLLEDGCSRVAENPDTIQHRTPIECQGTRLGTLTIQNQKDANRHDEHVNVLLTDVVEKLATHLFGQQLIAKTNFQANHDSLTGLPNRHYFTNQLEEAGKRATKEGKLCAVALMDLDGFKRINDSLGHHVGDRVLSAVAERLKELSVHNELVARLGGDEFAILINDLDSQEDGIKASQRYLDAMQRPFDVGGREHTVGASFGISFYPDGGSASSSMLQQADSAMYFAKANGRNHCQQFTQSIADQANNRLLLEQALRRAMNRDDELFMVYQPIFDLKTGSATGVETLVRWQHPERGFVAPSEFIPMAEESGLILQLSEWIMHTACSTIADWNRKLRCPIQLSVNVTPLEIEQVDFDQRVLRLLEAVDFDPRYLDLEVTETFMMKRFEEVSIRLGRLRSKGVKVSIDDFGAGYSCMSYLHRLPVDRLKIDRSFVNMLDFDPDQPEPKGLAIAGTIVALAKSVGLQTVTEGVETQNQLQHAIDLGADLAQGYLLSKPLSEQDAFKFFQRHQQDC